MKPSTTAAVAWADEYAALVERAGLIDLGRRTAIELAGADRASFLHNLCTNEVRKLAAGAGCEAFLTTVQGKTLAHVFIFAGSDRLVIDTVPDQNEKILAHLDHYLVCEQVTLADRTPQRSALFVGGPGSETILRKLTDLRLSDARLAHAIASLAGKNVWLARTDWIGEAGFLVSCPNEDLPAVRGAILDAGAAACGPEAFDAARIEWGFPWFGRDISDDNLPQEIARDRQAISFVKGCYLGQETVARIDALGHVNKTLVGLRFDGQKIPERGTPLDSGGQNAGHVTSAAYSPRLAAPLALAFVRRNCNAPGTRLASTAGEAEVVVLPVR